MKQIIALFSELYIRLCLIRKHFSCKKSQIIWSSIKTSRSNTCHLEGCYLSLSDINISDQQNSVILRGGRIYRCSIIIEGTNNSLYIDNIVKFSIPIFESGEKIVESSSNTTHQLATRKLYAWGKTRI